MQSPIISIIIPTYNRCHLIGQTLESIISQTYLFWECIVIDDHSSDYTEELMEFYTVKDSRIKYYHRPEEYQKGGNACRNFGFAKSKGKYINWFDDDDIMIENKLDFQLQTLANSDQSFIVCQSLVFEGNIYNTIGYRKNKINSSDFFNDFIINEIKWLTQAPLIKKNFLIKNEIKFDESLHQSQERDYFVKILAITSTYLFDNTPLVLLRKHENSISYSTYDSCKKLSTFNVNYNILSNYNFLLKLNTKRYLVKSLNSSIKESIFKKDFPLLFYMLNKYSSSPFIKSKDKRKLFLGCIMYFIFKKGERFFA